MKIKGYTLTDEVWHEYESVKVTHVWIRQSDAADSYWADGSVLDALVAPVTIQESKDNDSDGYVPDSLNFWHDASDLPNLTICAASKEAAARYFSIGLVKDELTVAEMVPVKIRLGKSKVVKFPWRYFVTLKECEFEFKDEAQAGACAHEIGLALGRIAKKYRQKVPRKDFVAVDKDSGE